MLLLPLSCQSSNLIEVIKCIYLELRGSKMQRLQNAVLLKAPLVATDCLCSAPSLVYLLKHRCPLWLRQGLISHTLELMTVDV